MGYLAKASTPVALLVLGGQFEKSSIKGLKKQITLGVMGRLVFAPLIGLGGAILLQKMGILQFDNGTYAALIALFATPAAVASAIMAEEMGNDGQLAGQLVVWYNNIRQIILNYLSMQFLQPLIDPFCHFPVKQMETSLPSVHTSAISSGRIK